MSIKAILFDLFGVLFKDSWKEWLKENKEELSNFANSSPPLTELGLRASYPEYYSDLIRINTDEKKVDGNIIIDDNTFYSILEKASGKPAPSIREVIHDTSVINKDIVLLLKLLKEAQFKIGLVTNGDQAITHEFLDKYNLTLLFDAIVTSSDVGKQKPDPSIFNQTAFELDVSLSEMLLIDDSEKIVIAAQELGIKSIFYYDQTSDQLKREIGLFDVVLKE